MVDWIRAINDRRLACFSYEGLARVVIPAAYGLNEQTGNLLLRAYQIAGRDATRQLPTWSLFRVDQMVGGAILDEVFDAPPPDYRRGDRSMTVIYAQL